MAAHTFDTECPACEGEHGGPGRCDHVAYSARFVRFVRVPLHREAYLAAYEASDPRTSNNELERLRREFQTLPPRHDCSCIGYHCAECARIQRGQQTLGTVVTIGRTSPVHPPTPYVLMLDLQRALSALGERESASRVALFLSEGDWR